MSGKLRELALCLTAIGLIGAKCSNAPEEKQAGNEAVVSTSTGDVALMTEMESVAKAIVEKSSREETYARIETLVSKHDEQALLAIVADKYRQLDPVPSRRIVSQLAEAGYKKFGTAKWQYYHAFYVGTGVDTPPDPVGALAILDQPATGTMRSALTLRAKMLMRLEDKSGTQQGKVKELLEQAAAQGDGEAKGLLEKLGIQN